LCEILRRHRGQAGFEGGSLMQVQVRRRTVEDTLELVRREASTIPTEQVYFALKKMRIKWIYTQTVETMRFCLAVHRLGLRVTSPLMAALRGNSESSVMETLHMLGDKKCLTLLRGSKKDRLQWIVSPIFLDHYDGGQGDYES